MSARISTQVTTTSFSGVNAFSTDPSNSGRACKDGWRLPTLYELQSLVDKSKTQAPYIDTTAFPNTPADWFWTSTCHGDACAKANPIGSAGRAWVVLFGTGETISLGTPFTALIRCVR